MPKKNRASGSRNRSEGDQKREGVSGHLQPSGHLPARKRPECPSCGKSGAVRRGFRLNFSGKKQLFLCTSCGRKFTQDDGYLRMRFPPGIIREAVSLYSRDFSLSEVQKRLERRKGVRVSRWTILKWARRYGR